MHLKRRTLSERLELVSFIGTSGAPKRYMVSKIGKGDGGLYHCDTAPFIWFWTPELSFRETLKPGGPKHVLGPGTWLWTRDLSTLLVLDDMEFHIRPDEAKALESALFDCKEV